MMPLGIDVIIFNRDGQTLVTGAGKITDRYDIPKGVTDIGYSAFHFCGGLKEITLP